MRRMTNPPPCPMGDYSKCSPDLGPCTFCGPYLQTDRLGLALFAASYREYEPTIPPSLTYGITKRVKDIQRCSLNWINWRENGSKRMDPRFVPRPKINARETCARQSEKPFSTGSSLTKVTFLLECGQMLHSRTFDEGTQV